MKKILTIEEFEQLAKGLTFFPWDLVDFPGSRFKLIFEGDTPMIEYNQPDSEEANTKK